MFIKKCVVELDDFFINFGWRYGVLLDSGNGFNCES